MEEFQFPFQNENICVLLQSLSSPVQTKIDDESTTEIENQPYQKNVDVNDNAFSNNELTDFLNEYLFLREKYIELQEETNTKLITNKDKEKLWLEEMDALKLQKENVEANHKKELVQLTEAYEKTIERMETDITSKNNSITEAVSKLETHDAAAKRAITVLQKEMSGRVDQITKMYEDALKENKKCTQMLSKAEDDSLVKITKLETVIDQLQKDRNIQNKKICDQNQEVEKLRVLLKNKDSDLMKQITFNENLVASNTKQKKSIEQQKEEIDLLGMKIKWPQNKLKTELEAHKETKKQLSVVTCKLQETKEEASQIRQNCQEMIQRYQGDEEIESVRLNKVIKEKDAKISEYQQIIDNQKQELDRYGTEVEALEQKLNELEMECKELNNTVSELNETKSKMGTILCERDKDFADSKMSLDNMKDEIEDLKVYKSEIDDYEKQVQLLQQQNDAYKQQIHEQNSEIISYKTQQHDMLSFTQNLTENNAAAKSLASDLQSKLDALLMEKEEILSEKKSLEYESNKKMTVFDAREEDMGREIEELQASLRQKTQALNDLTELLNQVQDDLKISRRKNHAQVKDLQKQLTQTTRKLDLLENGSGDSVEDLSLKSRTSSCNSLEKFDAPSPPHNSVMIPQDHYINQPRSNRTEEIEIDKRVLVERICKLQRLHAKKNDKIEFLEEHIMHLTENVQKKAKIIQFYVVREEAGSLVPQQSDKNKAQFSQHGGIMASVYSARPTDKAMTLELSLQINSKLQAVLEDTILKNIMLKENINTLGMEIDRLQKESYHQ